MTTQHLDSEQCKRAYHSSRHYYTEVPAKPIDEQSHQVSQLIDMAFDTLGVHHLDVRVLASARGGEPF